MNCKIVRTITISFLSMATLFLLSFSVLAKEADFEINDQVQDADGIFVRLDLENIEEPVKKRSFSCFDANEQGEYVLGFNSYNRDYLLVYSSLGEFLYGFSFIDNGNFGVKWEGNNLNLYRSRSDLIITVDNKGNCLGINEITNAIENHDHWRKEIYANTRSINGTTYTAKHWLYNHELLHWGAYQRLIRSTPTGQSVVLYSRTVNLQNLFFVILFGITVTTLVAVIIAYSVKSKLEKRY